MFRGRGYRWWFRATGLPGWMRFGYMGYPPFPPAWPPFHLGYYEPSPEEELQMLEEEKQFLEQELDEINRRIEEIKREISRR